MHIAGAWVQAPAWHPKLATKGKLERGSLQSGAISRYTRSETQQPPRMTHVCIATSLVGSRDVVANSWMSKVLKNLALLPLLTWLFAPIYDIP